MSLRDIKWSKTERAVAKRAFDRAYRRECEAITKHISGMIRDSTRPENVWHVHDFLSKARAEIDAKYDYRYSVLIVVFARLMREGWLQESDIDGLDEEKVAEIIVLAGM